MKKLYLILLVVFCLAACGGGGDDSGNKNSVRELAVDETASDVIDEEGEVHMYHLNAVENRTLSVNLSGTRKNSPVDFMLTIYEKGPDGNLVTIFGESAAEDATKEADITINVPINGSRDLYMAVRDFKDDDASDMIKYRLKASYSGEVEDNNTFENAINLAVGNTKVCHTEEAITPKGDEDCYRFTIGGDSTAGVYRISAQYDPAEDRSIAVILDIEMYNETGQLVQQFKGEKPSDDLYVMLPHLEEGEYFMVIGAQGRNTADDAPYNLCIEPVSVDELQQNDTSDAGVPDVLPMDPVAGEPGAVEGSVTGSLEYIQDQDWYEVDVTAGVGVVRNIVINFSHGFSGQVPEALQQQGKPFKYRVSVIGETNDPENPTYTFDYSVLAAEQNIVEIGARPGTKNYIVVQPIFKDQMLMAMPYQMTVKLRDLNDPTEQEDPITLESGVPANGKISQLGDKDDYEIAVTADTTPKILEVFFSTPGPSQVSYAVAVEWDGKTRVIRDTNGVSQGAECKSSFYIPNTETVKIQVFDDQNNDGDDVQYTLLAREVDIPTNLAGVTAPSPVSSPTFHGEIAENTDPGTEITVIEYNKEVQPKHKANTSLLRVDALQNNQWTSGWIAGYVDYDGDRDLFELNVEDVVQGDTWYCDLQIQIVAPGSEVEYSWTLFRDAAPVNDVVVERMYLENVGTNFEWEIFPEGGGIVASWADNDHEDTTSLINVTIPDDAPDDPGNETDHLFWIGKDSQGSKFYLSLNDFNRAVLTTDPRVPNPVPDNDWGYAPSIQPYYFHVTVTYHDDRGCPEPYQCD